MNLERMPDAEVAIDIGLVRALLGEQHPDLASLPLVEAGEGWDNKLFRLGDELVVRLPRRQLAARLIEYEQRWLPALAPHLPLPVPAPVRVRATGLRVSLGLVGRAVVQRRDCRNSDAQAHR